MTSRAFFPAKVSRVTVAPEVTSGREKIGALVPRDNIVETVSAMVLPP
jgi:hypothetical protein